MLQSKSVKIIRETFKKGNMVFIFPKLFKEPQWSNILEKVMHYQISQVEMITLLKLVGIIGKSL